MFISRKYQEKICILSGNVRIYQYLYSILDVTTLSIVIATSIDSYCSVAMVLLLVILVLRVGDILPVSDGMRGKKWGNNCVF